MENVLVKTDVDDNEDEEEKKVYIRREFTQITSKAKSTCDKKEGKKININKYKYPKSITESEKIAVKWARLCWWTVGLEEGGGGESRREIERRII